jgi:hypothetical protein
MGCWVDFGIVVDGLIAVGRSEVILVREGEGTNC